MLQYGLPVLFALFVWWFSTGIILLLNNLPERTFRWSLTGGTVVMLAAIWGLAASSTDASVTGAYCAFTCGVLVWGWHEMSFFMGLVTGPRRHACSHGCGGWAHFVHGVQACLWHEIAIIVSAAAVVWATWAGANQVGMWTFMVLWGMRQSSKLNVFLGVLNLNEQFLPERLAYLSSYFRRRPMNVLFPFSVTLGTIVSVAVVNQAVADAASPFQAAGATFLATMLILGVIEHWFLVLPLPFAEMWAWSLRFRQSRTAPAAARGPRRAYARSVGRIRSAARAALRRDGTLAAMAFEQPEVGAKSRPIGGVP